MAPRKVQSLMARNVDLPGILDSQAQLTTATWTVLETARTFGLTAYDAAYLDLARHRGIALATLDDDIAKACAAAGIALAA